MEIHKHYTIGQAAEETGLSIHTLRYYEKEGLLPNIKRSESGIRLFEDEDIQWIKLLLCLRRMDMPIVQLKEYAHLTLQTLQGHETMDERVQILENQKEQIEEHSTGSGSRKGLRSRLSEQEHKSRSKTI